MKAAALRTNVGAVLRIVAFLCAAIFVSTLSLAASKDCLRGTSKFQVGLAKADFTAAILGKGMLGYADPFQRANGIHMLLWSRALYLEDPCSQHKTIMVIADLAMVYAGLKKEVLKRLEAKRPGFYKSEEILLSATHTHSGPGSFSHHALYNITSFGFDAKVFDIIASAITKSIEEAYEKRFEGTISFHSGKLEGQQFNRSTAAYLANPEAERKNYKSDVDKEMQLLLIKDSRGKKRGGWTWFPVHGVSLSARNRLLSGDNKGLASYMFEKKASLEGIDFVAGFVQSHSGDVSPYPIEVETQDDTIRNIRSGRAQFLKAEALTLQKGEALNSRIENVERRYDMRNRKLADLKSGEIRKTCEGTLGVSFAAGTENGRPLKIFSEGTVYGRDWPSFSPFPAEQKCQAEKVVLLPTGIMKPYAWTSNVAPLQIHRIGSLAIVALPFELTTMSGRRLKTALLEEMKAQGIKNIVISALANDYMHYLTTREEYALQDYEAGSNLFGPWSLDYVIENFRELAKAMNTGTVVELGALDRFPKEPFSLPSLPAFDWPGFTSDFSEAATEVNDSYSAGSIIEFSVHGGEIIDANPRLIELQIDRDSKEHWVTVNRLGDPDLTVSWERQFDLNTIVHLQWQSRKTDIRSRYRICHEGSSQLPFADRKPYKSCSRGFFLTN